MSQAENQPPTVREVIFEHAAPFFRRLFLLFLANAVFLILYARGIAFLFPSVGGGLWILGFEVYAFLIAGYAGGVYLWSRSGLSSTLGSHCYALAVLGFGFGGVLDAWGGYGFLSLGYWLRQAGRESPSACGRDGGELVVFGSDSLACPKCSRVVRVGYDIPRSWARAGFVVFGVGVLLYALDLSVSALNTPFFTYVSNVMVFAGLMFAVTFYLQRGFYGGYVRIPSPNRPSLGESTTS